jgi:hypothetical protein
VGKEKSKTKSVTRKENSHAASDSYLRWAESVSGMLTGIKTEYGTVGQMLEDANWDDGKTDYAVRLTLALRDTITKIAAEMTGHVQGKSH